MKYIKLIDGLIEFIESRIHKNECVCIDDVTKISGYSKRHIQSIFKKKTGLTISTYIKKRRLSHAAIFIKFTKNRIFNIAMTLNFSSLQSFTRSFTQEFKVSPVKYRKNVFFNCAYLTPPFSLNIGKFTLKRGNLGKLNLRANDFLLKESLVGSRLKRANNIRKKNITDMLKESKSTFIITTIIPSISMDGTVLMHALIGKEDDTPNYSCDVPDCWIVEFRGAWKDYVLFGRFFIYSIKVKFREVIIEKIELIDEKNDEYVVTLYFPLEGNIFPLKRARD